MENQYDNESCDEENDCGVMCHYSKTTGGWEPIEESCIECGYRYNDCRCDDDEEDEEDEDESDDDDGEQCYGVENVMIKRFTMAGGSSHWWNYYLEYNDSKSLLYIESNNGLELQFNKVLVQSFTKDGDERLKMVDKDYELNKAKNECFIIDCILHD